MFCKTASFVKILRNPLTRASFSSAACRSHFARLEVWQAEVNLQLTRRHLLTDAWHTFLTSQSLWRRSKKAYKASHAMILRYQALKAYRIWFTVPGAQKSPQKNNKCYEIPRWKVTRAFLFSYPFSFSTSMCTTRLKRNIAERGDFRKLAPNDVKALLHVHPGTRYGCSIYRQLLDVKADLISAFCFRSVNENGLAS